MGAVQNTALLKFWQRYTNGYVIFADTVYEKTQVVL